MLQIPLHDELGEAGDREVVEVQLPGRGELVTPHLVVVTGPGASFERRPIRMWSRRGRGGEWRRRESNPLLLGASEAFFQKNLIPKLMRTGRVEPPQSLTLRVQRSELAGARRPRERVARVGFEPTVSSS